MGFHGGNVFFVLGELYIVILIIRALLSWIPMSADSPFSPVARVVYTITEPVLAPFRRFIPPVGGIDLSFIVAFLVVLIIVNTVLVQL